MSDPDPFPLSFQKYMSEIFPGHLLTLRIMEERQTTISRFQRICRSLVYDYLSHYSTTSHVRGKHSGSFTHTHPTKSSPMNLAAAPPSIM